ncbi:hypothetical protein ACXPWS_13625 [Mycobacterium sp. BMJ-28]
MAAVNEPIRTYSLEEVAAMALPADWKTPERWLTSRLKAGEIGGYKLGRASWRMTHTDVEDMIAKYHNGVRPTPVPASPVISDAMRLTTTPAEGMSILDGLSPRSRAYRERYGVAGNPNMQGPRKNRPVVPIEKSRPAEPRDIVRPEAAEAIAKMGPLSRTQQALLDRVRREGRVVVGGQGVKRVVESLARRDLVTYEAVHQLNEKWMYRSMVFTLTAKA